MYGERKKDQPGGPLGEGTERGVALPWKLCPPFQSLGGVRISSVHLGTFSGQRKLLALEWS